ncbi:glycosyl transferase family 1 [Terracoccus luteus]|uniref:Glycosyl transferase family 1 n=1 Tax=Terracoccus luteus TaxID=53356 RepID=A0A495XVR0_9MICO|nr:glycosyltransferase [Terracoccus luteus]RKT78661.1 glycosyl transferase family 1 [Terracoccus luteus]
MVEQTAGCLVAARESAGDAPHPVPVREALAAVRDAPTLLEALRLGPDLERSAAAEGPDGADVLLEATRGTDALTASLAVRALGRVGGPASADALVDLLTTGPDHLRDAAAEALRGVTLTERALAPLAEAVAEGGFRGMLAQWTLEVRGATEPDAVGRALEAALARCSTPAGRAALVETWGLLHGEAAEEALCRLALDDTEPHASRAAATAALGDREPDAADRPAATAPRAPSARHDALAQVVDDGGPLGSVAALALSDLARPPAAAESPASATPAAPAGPFTVAQLFLHADVDGDLSRAGQGDTGGIATLLVQLGDALLQANPGIGRVLTVSRGRPDDAALGLVHLDRRGHHYLSVPLWGPPVPAGRAWPLRVAVRRGLRRILRAAGRVDALHLRMGDVATMVAADVADELGIPVVFTLAPDPNALVASRDAAGTLTREGFGEADAVEHLVFRERLLGRLQRRADHLVLFPRPHLADDMARLMGLDVRAEADRVTPVAEGISLEAVDRAAEAVTTATPPARERQALDELDRLLDTLPAHRRRLPLAVSVGRLNRVKGTATLVQAWAADRRLHERCTLLVVGGDLADPSDDEREQLDAIDAVVPLDDAASRGLLLPGHRPNATVTTWLAAVRAGRPGRAAPHGVYVSSSLKEEFGIAILEAMATGLPVVAPATGGPATYVDDGVTGILVDTASATALTEAVHAALDLAATPDADDHAEQARRMVRERFGIAGMADALSTVYRAVAPTEVAR